MDTQNHTHRVSLWFWSHRDHAPFVIYHVRAIYLVGALIILVMIIHQNRDSDPNAMNLIAIHIQLDIL
ncbi:MAG TPA: hypothetical protein DDY14_07250 [Chromatiaceae bacterium]|jgi:hypothetical protein|nr:MAG: hypothetical protein N838_30500 [Thiohalocapsa sp. PB-PSB1]HBG95110.1 hypothetical protein [Chromatiaceae bacterium]HCS91465.1 hypothetical protein [Chromatiaceae bacterium]